MSNRSIIEDRKSILRTFHRNSDGSVAALFGLMAIALFLTIGGAVDFGRWLHARNHTIAAIDSAVLAGGRSLQVHGDSNAAVTAAQAYYAENIQNRLPVNNDSVNFVVAEDGLSISAAGNAYIETPILSLAQIYELALLDTAGADYSKAEIGVGSNAGVNLEISMMLDVTGSMSGDKIADLKLAAKDLVDIVVWDDQSEYSSRIALVPFSEGIRLPDANAIDTARGTLPGSINKYGRTYYRSDCVAERTGANAYSDAAPGSGAYVLGVYVRSSSGSCKPSTSNKLRPLSNNKTDLKDWIDDLTTTGGTGGHLGTAWSWYTLSPNWNALWSSSNNNAVPYGTADTQKIAILMTDGEYNRQYDADGISVWSGAAENGSSTTQARQMCTNMKAAGITVYTVGFGLSAGSEAATTLSLCATDASKSFTAADGDELRQSFRSIALEISKLYLSS